MTDCVFCKIIKGELPCSKVYDDEHVIAFLDIHPTRPGHTLVVPKAHCDDFLACDAEAAAHMMRAAKKIAPAVMKGVGAEGFNIGINNGRTAGQIIFHLHLHIIPRKDTDGLKLWGHSEYAEGEIASIAEEIRNAVN